MFPTEKLCTSFVAGNRRFYGSMDNATKAVAKICWYSEIECKKKSSSRSVSWSQEIIEMHHWAFFGWKYWKNLFGKFLYGIYSFFRILCLVIFWCICWLLYYFVFCWINAIILVFCSVFWLANFVGFWKFWGYF